MPLRIRQSLNVEAGLNDGLSVPFLLLFIVLAVAEGHTGPAGAVLARFLGEQLGYGTLIGIGIGTGRRMAPRPCPPHAAGWLQPLGATRRGGAAVALRASRRKRPGRACSSRRSLPGWRCRVGYKLGKHSVEFTEEWGQMLNLSIFFVGRAAACAWRQFSLAAGHLYAVLSLTVVRMLPVAVAVIGTRLSRATVLFMGWFGPRGLASIVLGAVYLEHAGHEPG